MGKYTNEKALVVVQDNFLTKIKNFFAKAFWSRKSKFDMIENEEDDNIQDYSEKFEEQEQVVKERRLYNFDADNNDDWPGDVNMNDVHEKDVNDVENANIQNEEQLNEAVYEIEEYSEAYREKQELEQKLMNYYESIKKRNLNFET